MKKGFTTKELINIMVAIVVLSVFISIIGYNFFTNNVKTNTMYLGEDMEKIVEHLNSKVGENKDDIHYMYGKRINYIYLLKNSDLRECMVKGKVSDMAISVDQIINNNTFIISLEPFISGLDLKLEHKGFIGIEDREAGTFSVAYIDCENIPFKKISIENYYKIINKSKKTT